MPFDGKTFTETKPDLSLESLLRFCESKPARAVYCYRDSGRCLMAQFHDEMGSKYMPPGLPIDRRLDTPDQTLERIAVCNPHTFGAAADRIRRLLRERAA